MSILESENLAMQKNTSINEDSPKLVEFIRRKSFTYGESKEKVITRLGDLIVLEEEKEMITRFLKAMKERRIKSSKSP